MKKLLLMMMALVLSIPIWAGEKTIVINRNEGIYEDGTGAYYCTKGGITMTFSSGLNNVNYLVEHQQVVFDIFSTNYVIKKIKFNCLDNTLEGNMDCFYWGPTTISEFTGAPYEATGSYHADGYIGTWTGGSTPSKYVKFVTRGKPVRFGSVEITIDKEFGDIYEKVTSNDEIQNGQTYALVSQYASKALGKEDYYGSDNLLCFTSTPVTLLDNNNKVKVTDEVQLIKLQSSGNSTRPWYLKVGDNYIRRRSSLSGSSSGAANGQGYNLHSASTVTSYEQYFRVSISVSGNTNQNALIRFDHNSSETAGGKTFAIRHYNGGNLFRDMDYSSNNEFAANQRVYLYKPAQSYEVTTECIPSNGGYITLGDGILTDNQGKNWSQHFDNVTFFVGPTDGYGIGEVTITDLTGRAVTVLQPTATSDFGNDYSFEMPANDVKITANFLSPVEIDTICSPANGGQFNFINGYTNFSGQYYSNEGKTVTFKPTAADGYIFNAVTYTDNVTGTTTTLTPDANGVYSFVMPGNKVTLTANFEEAHDLYLLGTANGKISWLPSGPKFNFDSENQVYYLDVYFKGGNSDPNTDPAYGYFSLTKKIDENGNWDNINGYRLGAEYDNYGVGNGSTAQLYPNHNNDAFKIPPGVYRITVNPEMTSMSIAKYDLWLTFNPESGSIVESGQVVTIGNNLEELVHAINPDEDDPLFFNTTDDWAHQENDNTAEIIEEGITTLKASSTLGYIIVNGEAQYEIVGDLYLLGTAISRRYWAPSGPKFNYDAENEQYYLDVYFRGGVDDLPTTPEYQHYGYFSLATHVSDYDWTQLTGFISPGYWNDVSGRLGAETDDLLLDVNETGVALYGDGNHDNCAFKIPAGIYRITVNKDKTLMNIIEDPAHLYFEPVSGSTVEAGTRVTISSDLQSKVWAIAESYGITESAQNFQIKTDDMTNWNDNGQLYDNDIFITREGDTTYVHGYVEVGYIVVQDTAEYFVPGPPEYNITTSINPADAGVITAPQSAIEGATITFTVTPNSGYATDNVEVCLSNGAILPLTDNGNGTYSFTMPNNDVTIYGDFVRATYQITTVVDPHAAGTINVQSTSMGGETVNFTLTTSNPVYSLIDVVMTYVDENNVTQSVTLTPDGDGNYSFVMPNANVTLTANYNHPISHLISTLVIPENVATVNVQQTAMEGEVVTFTLTENPNAFDDYLVYAVTLTSASSQEPITLTPTNGVYSFVMPLEDVLITAEYRKQFNVKVQWTPEDGGTAVIQGPHPSTQTYALEGTTVTIAATPNTHFVVAGITSSYTNLNIVDNGDGTYSFEMPHSHVTITVNFGPVGEYQVNLVNDPVDAGSISLSGHVKTEDGNYYSDEGQTVVITPVPAAGWTPTGVDVVDENDNPVSVTDNGDGTYSLVMPASNVTVTAHYEALPFAITTQVTPDNWGTINLMGDAADYSEFAGQTVTFAVEPGFGYGINEVYYTYGGTNYPLTDDDGDGIYSFVMPASNVKIVAKMSWLQFIFRQVYNTRDIVEGGTYIYVNKYWGFVMTYHHPDETSSWLINEFLQPDRSRIKVDRNALMFKALNVVDTTYASQHLFYGSMEEEPYKAAYLLCENNGKYLGLSDDPSYPYPVEFYDAVTPDNHDNLQALLRLQKGRYKFHGLDMDQAVWSYYPNVWSDPMTTEVSSGVLNFGYLLYHDETPETFNANCVYLYKMPQPYTVTTQCVEPDWGTIDLTGVVGNIAMDGDTIIVTPHGIGDHGCAEVIVTINGTNEQIDVTRNPDRTFTFVMPAADVTVTAYFDDGHTLTMTFNTEVTQDDADYDYVSLDGLVLDDDNLEDEDDMFHYFTHLELDDVVRETNILFEVWAGDDSDYNDPEGYVVESVTMDAAGVVTEIPCVSHNVEKLTFVYYCVMPDDDATITVNLLPAHLVTYNAILNGEPAPASCGSVGYYSETLNPRINYFVENEDVVLEVHQQPGYRLDHVTAVIDETGETIDLSTYKDPTGLPGLNARYYYNFIMPDEAVTVTAYFEKLTPLSFIEQDRTEGYNPPVSEEHVVVSDELVGVWAVKNLLWAKDQSPYTANDSVDGPGDTYDYVRQNMKLQKHEWDQSNWVILDFSKLSDWNGTEADYIKVEEFVDHKIKAGSISGIYYCEGNLVKAQHEIVLDAWPVIENPTDFTSLGYPGYMQDPKEELTNIDYMYNHYVPSNFLKENIGGRYGEGGTYGAVPGNPAYRDVRFYFMNPKDDEVAQVWAVWYGEMEFYDEYSEQNITADVFETFEPDYDAGVNIFGLEGAFYVPSWKYNRKSPDRNDYGKPDGDNTLEKNVDYLFHIAIQRHGEDEIPSIPEKAPKRGQGTQATDREPWTYYMVYPLDLDPDNSISTSVREINSPASTTIDSIRYYNLMGQESKTPFDGINIMVIRYKDGSFISKKVLR